MRSTVATCAVEDLVVGVGPIVEAQDDLVAEAIGDAVDLDLLLARRLGVRRRGIGEHGAPVQGEDVLGRGRGGAGDHLAHGRVGGGDLCALVVESARTCSSSASSISVPSKRSPRLSGASCGWSGSMIAAPSSASSASVASTGKVLTLSASGASSGETKRPPSSLRTGCVESRRAASAPARSRPSGTGVVLWTHSITRQRPSPRSSADIRRRPCRPPCSKGSTCGARARSASGRPGASRRRGTA